MFLNEDSHAEPRVPLAEGGGRFLDGFFGGLLEASSNPPRILLESFSESFSESSSESLSESSFESLLGSSSESLLESPLESLLASPFESLLDAAI